MAANRKSLPTVSQDEHSASDDAGGDAADEGTAPLEALGDGTRRTILELLHDGPRTIGQLADELPVSRPAVSQHVAVLRRAGLVQVTVAGTRHIVALDPRGLEALRAYIEQLWSASLAGFDRLAADETGVAGRGRSGRP